VRGWRGVEVRAVIAHLTWQRTLAIDVAVWVVWSVLAGWFHARRSLTALERPGPITRLRPFERGGDWYARRIRVRAWKDHLPEAGTWFGGLSKSHLPSGDRRTSLERFAAESLRAERTHWTVLAVTPVFAIWNGGWLLLANIGFAAAINAPCVAVARFNRARIAAIVGASRA
jgi:glycosyl-4,4'-diaponeurosporenoate acyltransferase